MAVAQVTYLQFDLKINKKNVPLLAELQTQSGITAPTAEKTQQLIIFTAVVTVFVRIIRIIFSVYGLIGKSDF